MSGIPAQSLRETVRAARVDGSSDTIPFADGAGVLLAAPAAR